jgi:hypothetical protein
MAVRLSALRAGLPLPPGRFMVLISVRGWVHHKAHIAARRIRWIENCNYLIGNRTSDLPACSIVPPTYTLPRAPNIREYQKKIITLLHVHTLLGNRLVNKFPRRQILDKQSVARLRNYRRGCVFYVFRTKASAGNVPMNSQSDTWHVFSVGSVPRGYKRIRERDFSPEEFVVEFRGSRVIEQEMARRLHSNMKC